MTHQTTQSKTDLARLMAFFASAKKCQVAKRAQSKPTYPGCLDHLVAGALGGFVPCFFRSFRQCCLAIRLDVCLLPWFFLGGN